MIIVPIKTSDVVINNGNKYYVKSVEVTSRGPLLKIVPILDKEKVVHITEVELGSKNEATHRIKSIGAFNGAKRKANINLPDGMSVAEAQQILNSINNRR